MTAPAVFAKDEKGRFQTGNIGGGRPVGSRNKLGEAFVGALLDDWKVHGVEAIQKVRDEKPAEYLRVIASILPKDINFRVGDLEDLSDEELAGELAGIAAQLAGEGGGAFARVAAALVSQGGAKQPH